jgi:hypothetical protein
MEISILPLNGLFNAFAQKGNPEVADRKRRSRQ